MHGLTYNLQGAGGGLSSTSITMVNPHGVGAGTELLGSCPRGEMGDVLAFP
jgi:hypothetical protein